MTKLNEAIQGPETPARVGPDHMQDRVLSKEAGAPLGYSVKDGLGRMAARKAISGDQLAAGRRLQDDYQESQMQSGARSSGERISGGKRGYDIPDYAHEAGKRVKAALAILPPEVLTMAIMFLLPNPQQESYSIERIALAVREHRSSVDLGLRIALHLLARHYAGG